MSKDLPLDKYDNPAMLSDDETGGLFGFRFDLEKRETIFKITPMTLISAVRFNALAGYARLPHATLFGEELAYFEADNGQILGMLMRDIEDNDYFGLVFAQDRKLRYRNVSLTPFAETEAAARTDLLAALAVALQAPPESHYQADEKGAPVDFFTPVRDLDQLNPNFVKLISEECFSPARGIIEPMMRWYEDADGNFVEQFQTTGFDQRIWELYLFATFIEQRFQLDRSKAIPDFVCDGLVGSFAAEAVTVGPTRKGNAIVASPATDTPEALDAYLNQYLPIKFGSSLTSKLAKRYWERPNVAGAPFVLAIADFSSPGSMMYSSSSLERYLYGYDHDAERDADGRLTLKPRRIGEHRFGEKVIPSGFFDLPDSDNIGAVLTTASGTISKFNRMGLLAGFGSGNVVMIREGTAVDRDPDASQPKRFRVLVNAAGYDESWIEGLNVFHNPKAALPFDEGLLPSAAHHIIDADGVRRSRVPDFHPYASVTRQMAPVDVAEFIAAAGDATHVMWTPRRDGGVR